MCGWVGECNPKKTKQKKPQTIPFLWHTPHQSCAHVTGAPQSRFPILIQVKKDRREKNKQTNKHKSRSHFRNPQPLTQSLTSAAPLAGLEAASFGQQRGRVEQSRVEQSRVGGGESVPPGTEDEYFTTAILRWPAGGLSSTHSGED